MPPGEGSLFFVANTTVLVRCAGFTLPTDPTFIHKHEQNWLCYGLQNTRLIAPQRAAIPIHVDDCDDLQPLLSDF